MGRRFRLLALVLGWLPLALHAQGAAADPITGTWVGDLGPDAASRMRVSIELKFDGMSVRGLLTSQGLAPGDIAGGTYDARTGAVNFTVAVRGGDMKVQFAGTLQGDTIAGRVTSTNVAGTFTIVRGAQRGAAPPADSVNIAVRAAVRSGFTRINDLVASAIALVPPDKYGYRPVATARSFGEVVGQIADSYQYYCGTAVRGNAVQRSNAIEKGPTDRRTLTQKIRFAIEMCTGASEDGDLVPLMENVVQANQHYGTLVTYIRMLGLTPPGS
jgi:hypothetical protein